MRQFSSVPIPCSNIKRRNLFSPLMLLSGLLFLMLIVSCSKKGPAGADGPAGPPGPAGPKGDPGSGSSSVIYSEWLNVAFKPDTIHRAGGVIDTIGYFASIDAPKLTQALLNTSDVKAYYNASDASNPVIFPLPYSSYLSGLYIEMSASSQKINLYSNGDMSTVLYSGKMYYQYRYMIVPGNTTANAASKVNWSDYSAAKTFLKLKD